MDTLEELDNKINIYKQFRQKAISGWDSTSAADYNKAISYLEDLRGKLMKKKPTTQNPNTVAINKTFIFLCEQLKTVGDPAFKQAIIKDIVKGTKHEANELALINFHNDFEILAHDKSLNYGYALGIIQSFKDGAKDKAFTNLVESSGKPPQSMLNELNEVISVQSTRIDELEILVKEKKDENTAIRKALEELKKETEKMEQNQAKIIQIIAPSGEIKIQLEPTRHHFQLQELYEILQARNASGHTEFLWISGAPAAGKTYIGKTLAKMLQVKYYVRPADPTVTASKLLGFKNLLSGQYQTGWFREPYEHGGLLAIDEGDLMDPSCFAGVNSIENDEFMFEDGTLVPRHKDFYFVVFANTRGQGAQGGFFRNKLDAATLDRFTMVELHYDEELEKTIFLNKAWAEYVQKARKDAAKHMQGKVYITPRATRKGAALLATGKFTPERVADMTIFKLCNADSKASILSRIGVFRMPEKTEFDGMTDAQIIQMFKGRKADEVSMKEFMALKLHLAVGLCFVMNPMDRPSIQKRLKFYAEKKMKITLSSQWLDDVFYIPLPDLMAGVQKLNNFPGIKMDKNPDGSAVYSLMT